MITSHVNEYTDAELDFQIHIFGGSLFILIISNSASLINHTNGVLGTAYIVLFTLIFYRPKKSSHQLQIAVNSWENTSTCFNIELKMWKWNSIDCTIEDIAKKVVFVLILKTVWSSGNKLEHIWTRPGFKERGGTRGSTVSAIVLSL